MSNISQSTERFDYEILIRKRGENDYSSYSPQLNLILKGTYHEQVAEAMEKAVEEHIESLKVQKN